MHKKAPEPSAWDSRGLGTPILALSGFLALISAAQEGA